MSDEVLVKVENVSKKFCRSLKKSLWYGVQDIATELSGRKIEKELRPDEFWAVKDVSFEVKRGECLALIGPNGAGKSTLLKMLNNLIKPDKGCIRIRGRVGALIELGAGFNPILTGRENIYVNGAVLGLSKAEIDRKFDEIIEFAEIGNFLDTPVQNYSSGMKVRLGFAVAAHLNPDVMIIDEVLAVGDIGFRAKCFNKIQQIMKSSSVLFVSHNLTDVARICSNIIVLNHGKAEFQDQEISVGIEKFYSLFKETNNQIIGGEKAEIIQIQLESNGIKNINKINYLDDLICHINAKVHDSIIFFNIFVNIYTQDLQLIFQSSSLFDEFEICNPQKDFWVSLKLNCINLNCGKYLVEVGITLDNHGELLIKYQNIKCFQVINKYVGYAPVIAKGEWSLDISDKY